MNFKKELKKVSILLVVGTLPLVSACGKNAQKEEGPSALSIMETINVSNLLHPDNECRIWYEIDLTKFGGAISNSDSGHVKDVQLYMDYFSDGDPETLKDDLNINGLFVKNILKVDDYGVANSLESLNPQAGGEEDIARFCAAAKVRDMMVMTNINLAAASSEEEQFVKDLATIQETMKNGGSYGELPEEIRSRYYLNDSQTNENWKSIEGTDWYYYGYKNTNNPLIKLNSEYDRARITHALEYYARLGVNAFYLEDVQSYFETSQERKDFLNWFDETARSIIGDVIVVAQDSMNEEMRGISAYLSDTSLSGMDGAIDKTLKGSLSAVDLAKLMVKRSENSDIHTANMLGKSENIATAYSDLSTAQKKMALAIHLMLPGQTFIFAGDELGLSTSKDAPLYQSLELPDIEEKGDASSDGVEISIGNVAGQTADPNSFLNFVRQAVILRDSFTAVSSGEVSIVEPLCSENVLALRLQKENSQVIVVFNLSDSEMNLDVSSITIQDLPPELAGMLITSAEGVTLSDGFLYLPSNSMALLK